jgi:hypothetical protein
MPRRSKLLPAAALAALLVGMTQLAATAEPVDPSYPATSFWDLLAGSAADFADPAMGAAEPASGDNPYFMPDWNGNGVYGEQADVELEHSDDATVATFRYPCVNLDGTVFYRTVDDSCVAGDTEGARFRLGEIRKLSFVDSRGYRLAARLLVPEQAQEPGTSKLPGVVFNNGAGYPASSFYAYGMSFVRDGMIVLHYDQAGQGDSEGEMFGGGSAGVCPQGWVNFCLDAQDAMRWFAGQSIEPIVAAPARNPAYAPDGENKPNPLLSRLDTSRVGIAGQSAGSVATTVYTRYLDEGKGTDGRPLPAVRAAVGLSGFGPASAVVPIQAQSADYDIPGVTADNGGANVTDGPTGTHAWYENLRKSGKGDGALEEILIESGSHGDTSNVTHVPHAVWALSVSTGYAADWMNCFVQGQADACASAYQPREHLSRIYASEYDRDGPIGSAPSRCLSIPDQVNLGSITDPLQALKTITGQQNYDCTP